MFKCTIVEKYKAKGLPVDDIAPELRNRFNAMFGNSKLDGRFQVRLDERALRFFYYDYYAKDGFTNQQERNRPRYSIH